MSGRSDVAKGRIKEAAGALSGNDSLRRKGRTDQVVGKSKMAVKKTVRKVKKAAKKAINKL